MITPANTNDTYEFWLNNSDMSAGGVPAFDSWNDRPLANGCVAINMDTIKAFCWDKEENCWKALN